MKPKVAMLTAHSLFADGLASKLREYSNAFEFRVFDVQQDALNKLVAFHPFAVILEDTVSFNHSWSLQQLLGTLPGLVIICLNIGQPEIMVIHGDQYAANGTMELMRIIQQAGEDPALEFVRTAREAPKEHFT